MVWRMTEVTANGSPIASETPATLAHMLYSLFSLPGPFQRILVLTFENKLASLVMHRRPRRHYAGVSLRCKRDNFQRRI